MSAVVRSWNVYPTGHGRPEDGVVSLALGLASGSALAGPQYVDETGYALSGYDPVAFFELEQAPLGQPQPPAVPGRADITAEWNGATWAFTSEANRERFLADPEAFADSYTVLFEGALVLRQVHDRDDAARAVRPLIEQLIRTQLPPA